MLLLEINEEAKTSPEDSGCRAAECNPSLDCGELPYRIRKNHTPLALAGAVF